MTFARENAADESKLLLRAEEVAAKLSVGRATAYEMMAGGLLPTVKIGRSVRVPLRALEAWVEEHSTHIGR
jgi:excisionase family DNA binding protein